MARLAGIVTRAAAGRSVELNVNLSAVGDDVPPWLEKRMGVTVEKLVVAGSLAYLRGTPQEMADTLRRRRAATGVSYICAGVDNAERLAPVVELLHGQ